MSSVPAVLREDHLKETWKKIARAFANAIDDCFDELRSDAKDNGCFLEWSDNYSAASARS